jgi:hypothetical protein
MTANPDKFQALAIGKLSMDTNIVLDLAGNKIKCEKEVKLPELQLILNLNLILIFQTFEKKHLRS